LVDITAAEVLPGEIGPNVLGALSGQAVPLEAEYASLLRQAQSLSPSDPMQQTIQNEGLALLRSALISASAERLAEFFTLSQTYTDLFSKNLGVKAYYDS